MNEADEVVEKIDIAEYTQEGLNKLMSKHGFHKTASQEDDASPASPKKEDL